MAFTTFLPHLMVKVDNNTIILGLNDMSIKW